MNLFQAAGFPFSNVGLSKTWVSLGAPSFKIDTLFEMHRKNADAVVSANYVVLDGLNRLAQRQGRAVRCQRQRLHQSDPRCFCPRIVGRKVLEPGWRCARRLRLERCQSPRAV